MRLIEWLKSLLTPKSTQTCWVYCPGCRNELTDDHLAFVYDEKDGVFYRCSKCLTKSLWDFDAPVPLLRSAWKD